jgi:hypothetical protein
LTSAISAEAPRFLVTPRSLRVAIGGSELGPPILPGPINCPRVPVAFGNFANSADLPAHIRDRPFLMQCADKPVESVFWLCGYGRKMMAPHQIV